MSVQSSLLFRSIPSPLQSLHVAPLDVHQYSELWLKGVEVGLVSIPKLRVPPLIFTLSWQSFEPPPDHPSIPLNPSHFISVTWLGNPPVQQQGTQIRSYPGLVRETLRPAAGHGGFGAYSGYTMPKWILQLAKMSNEIAKYIAIYLPLIILINCPITIKLISMLFQNPKFSSKSQNN